jgi:hypothetical protein
MCEGHHGREKVHEGHRGRQTIEFIENKKRPKSSRQLRDFSVKFFTENHVFSSPAVSDLQAIRHSFTIVIR